MSEYEARVTRLTVVPKGEPTFSEQATSIEIEDEAAGEFLRVSQYRGDGKVGVLITNEEWPQIRAAIDRMIAECRNFD